MLCKKTQTAERVLAVNALFYTSACTAVELQPTRTPRVRQTPRLKHQRNTTSSPSAILANLPFTLCRCKTLVSRIAGTILLFRIQRLVALTTHLNKLLGVSLIGRPHLGHAMSPAVHLCALLNSILLVDLDWILAFGTLDDARNLDVVDAAEHGTLSLHLALGEVELRDGARKTICAVSDAYLVLRSPRVLQALINRYSLLNIDREHAVDEI